MSEAYKAYEKYKETNMFWATSMPSNWKEVKIKHLFIERSEKGYPDEPLLSATQSRGVIPTLLYENRTVVATKGLETLKLVEIGDFVISLRSFQGGIEFAYYRGIISPAYTVMTSNNRIYNGYFKYLAKSFLFIDLLKTCVTGIREGQNINYSLLKKAFIPAPSMDEQKQIECFLDFKISKINRFIKEKKREIEFLKELKQVEITHVLTKGLNPDVSMKDSGISWLGDIPSHWETKRVSILFDEQKTKNSDHEFKDAFQFKFGEIVEKKQIGTQDELKKTYEKYTKVNKDDIVINGLNLNYDFVTQRVGLVQKAGIITSAYISICPRKYINPQYACYLFKSMDNMKLLNGMGTGIRLTLSFGELKKQYIPYPNINEQEQILNYINIKATEIDGFVSKLNQEISLAQEFKTSIICEVVTGKIDVRNVKIDKISEIEGLEDIENEVETEDIKEE
jgi:type I restriction enzyme, S subunit